MTENGSCAPTSFFADGWTSILVGMGTLIDGGLARRGRAPVLRRRYSTRVHVNGAAGDGDAASG